MNVPGIIDKEQTYQAIEACLQQKYGNVFQVVALSNFFDGNRLFYYRATCTSNKCDGEFFAFFYDDETVSENVVPIGGDLYFMEDEYTDLLFKNEFMGSLSKTEDRDFMVICSARFRGKRPSAEELNNGIASCVLEKAADTSLTVFLIADPLAEVSELAEEIKQRFSKFDPAAGSFYLVQKPDFNKEAALKELDEALMSAEFHVSYSDFASKVMLYKYKTNQGFVSETVVKE